MSQKKNDSQAPDSLNLTAPEIPPTSDKPKRKARKLKAGGKRKTTEDTQVISYRHNVTRKNNPEVGMVNDANDPAQPKTEWAHNPHIAPELQFDVGRAAVEQLIDDALASGDETVMREALEELRRAQSPYLNWTGKTERTSFEVDTVSLHVHERIDPLSILSALQKRLRQSQESRVKSQFQYGLFNAPFENLPLRDAVDFYHHDKGWSNRLVAGDSLLVMNSLLQKESMAGQVQMIYLDPPYGIKYGSNFQPFVNKRDVKDRKDEDLTQEPEMIKAFRDTWELGIHSYLTYLRDRLLLAHDLLADSGSIFVQISDENLHHIREIMDETFGEKNFCSIISFQKTGSIAANLLPTTVDFIIWYAKSKPHVNYQQLYLERQTGDPSLDRYDQFRSNTGQDSPLKQINDHNSGKRFQLTSLFSDGASNTSQKFTFREKIYEPKGNAHWKTSPSNLKRLSQSNRIKPQGERLRYVRFAEDFNLIPLDDHWAGVQIGKQTVYVVQTAEKAIERCMLMTTNPGDLVLDPTCGSGTTAFSAEKWGRRWITCDTSRVAITLAKQRLMTASYDYYDLKYPQEGLKGGFVYKTTPHIMLKHIANNPEIDTIYEKMHPAIENALENLNALLHDAETAIPWYTVSEGSRKGEKIDFSAEDKLLEWEVPFDLPDEWLTEEVQQFNESALPGQERELCGVEHWFHAFHQARQAMQKRMDESIAANAGQEILYDQPQIAKGKLRITGPFSVEAVPFPTVLSLDEAEQPQQADNSIARSGETSRQNQWRDELLKTGVRGKNKQMLKFAELETLPGTKYLHASGTLETSERVVISFGPEHAALEQRQVENALTEAGELFPLPKMIVFCAFTFDPEAAKDIDAMKGITALKAQMNTDLLTEDLKKKRSNNESFWLMGQPDVEVRKLKDDQYQIEVHGFDYFDTKKGELQSGGKSKIAVWSLDTNYDNRSLFPVQVFFPMAGKKDGWYKLRKDIRAELDESQLDKFHGTVSLPFEAGDHKRIAVKIVDDRGIESLKVVELD